MATSNQSSMPELEALLTCPLCYKLVTDPMQLKTCQHSFCQKCIHSHFGSKKQCPTCDKSFCLDDVTKDQTKETLLDIYFNKNKRTNVNLKESCHFCKENKYEYKCMHCDQHACASCKEELDEKVICDASSEKKEHVFFPAGLSFDEEEAVKSTIQLIRTTGQNFTDSAKEIQSNIGELKQKRLKAVKEIDENVLEIVEGLKKEAVRAKDELFKICDQDHALLVNKMLSLQQREDRFKRELNMVHHAADYKSFKSFKEYYQQVDSITKDINMEEFRPPATPNITVQVDKVDTNSIVKVQRTVPKNRPKVPPKPNKSTSSTLRNVVNN